MPSADSVQVLPGIVRVFARVLSTNWEQLPDVDHCISVFIRPRAGNAAAIYLATFSGAGSLDRIELAATDAGVTFDIDNTNQLFWRAASVTPTAEVICILRGR